MKKVKKFSQVLVLFGFALFLTGGKVGAVGLGAKQDEVVGQAAQKEAREARRMETGQTRLTNFHSRVRNRLENRRRILERFRLQLEERVRVREEKGMNMEAARGELANLPALEAQYGEQLEAFDEAFEAALGLSADADLLAQYRGAGKNVKDSLGEIRQGLTRSVRLVKNSL